MKVDYNEIFSPTVKMTTIRKLHDIIRGFSVNWARRKPRVQVEEKCAHIKEGTEKMVLKVLQFYAEGSVQEMCYGPLLLLEESFAKQIIGMSIIRDKMKGTLMLSHEKYIGNVLEKFNMKDAKARYNDNSALRLSNQTAAPSSLRSSTT
ncbi:hypothetical protein Tco_0237532 [Tanacetum coccineum]